MASLHFLGYTWRVAVRRLWFLLTTLAVRGRFLMGKASFVEADVELTTHRVADSPAGRGAAEAGRLLAHFRLKTRKPRTGVQGWDLFEERLSDPGPHRAVRLECGYCGHQFFIQILAALDPLSIQPGQGAGEPASYASAWFEFAHEGRQGRESLSCPRCEQIGPPSVSFLTEG